MGSGWVVSSGWVLVGGENGVLGSENGSRVINARDSILAEMT